MTQTSGLFWHALLAFLALPGIVAFLVPWLLLPSGAPVDVTMLPIVVAGTGLLLWSIRDFYVAGQGTLAPWAPPKHLVTVGLYRISRNPMYLAVLVILVGLSASFRSLPLAVYAGGIAVAFHLRVVTYEEPVLARLFGRDWLAYRGAVPRWFGPRTPSTAHEHREPAG